MPLDDPIPPDDGKPPAPGAEDAGADAPPVNDETRWRQRAMAAEAAADELRASLEQARAQIAEAHEALDSCETKRAIDAALFETDALDLETARLMTEAAVAQMPERDVAAAIDELRRSKPFLFRSAPPGAALSTQSARTNAAAAIDLSGALEEAAVTGDRAALLRYLRLKRRA